MDIHVLTRILHGKILAVYLALRHVRVALFFYETARKSKNLSMDFLFVVLRHVRVALFL